jgi:hypothetical protein
MRLNEMITIITLDMQGDKFNHLNPATLPCRHKTNNLNTQMTSLELHRYATRNAQCINTRQIIGPVHRKAQFKIAQNLIIDVKPYASACACHALFAALAWNQRTLLIHNACVCKAVKLRKPRLARILCNLTPPQLKAAQCTMIATQFAGIKTAPETPAAIATFN